MLGARQPALGSGEEGRLRLSPAQAHVCAEGNAARKGEDEAAGAEGAPRAPGWAPRGGGPFCCDLQVA